MILTRTMTVDVDLPDAPAGYSWKLNHDVGAQVLLMRDGDPIAVGILTGLGADDGCPVLVDTRATRGAKPVIAQWAMVTLNNGKKIAEVLYADAFPVLLDAAKARLNNGFGYSPWARHERAMTALVPLRRALKRAPKSVLQLAPQYAITDDGEVIQRPQLGRDAAEVVAETNLLTSEPDAEASSDDQ